MSLTFSHREMQIKTTMYINREIKPTVNPLHRQVSSSGKREAENDI